MMLKYAKLVNEITGLCQIDLFNNSKEYNESIGMSLMNVLQSDIDGNWYIYDLCPLKKDTAKAEEARTYLTEQVNYVYKAKVAYTGVYTNYKGKEVIFETNKDSITLVTSTLLSLSSGVKIVKDWKFREVNEPYTPVSITLTALQFQQFVAFGQAMITSAFTVESKVNAMIEAASIENLCNAEKVKAFEAKIAQAYSAVPTRLLGVL